MILSNKCIHAFHSDIEVNGEKKDAFRDYFISLYIDIYAKVNSAQL